LSDPKNTLAYLVILSVTKKKVL